MHRLRLFHHACRVLFALPVLLWSAATLHGASSWRPLTDTRTFRGVWMSSATDGWAVGDAGLMSRTTDGGVTWTDQPSVVTAQLNAIWGTGPSSIWAVGNGGTIIRWNGTVWSTQNAGVTVDLHSVHGVNNTNVFAAGAATTILKYDGTTWSDETTPGAQNTILRGIWAADASNIWAVGNGGRIIKGNGTTWASQTSGTNNDLYAIWGTTTTNLITVGEAGTVRASSNGTSWNAGPASGVTSILRSVHGTSSSSIWITGDAGVIRFYNGSGGFAAQTSDTTLALHAIHAETPSAVFAVGANRCRDRFNGTTWTAVTSGLPNGNYNASWATDDDSVWFVGANGRAMRWNGTTFASGPATGTAAALNDVWGWDNNQVWAAGNNGTIIKWNGTAWSAQTSGTTQALNGLHGSGPSDVWAVGNAGTILRFNGTAWSVKTSPTTQNLTAVWATSPTAAWAVGANGVIIRWNGSSWSVQASGTTQDLNDINGSGTTAIWAVGARGTILKYSGSSWAAENSSINSTLTTVSVVNSTNVWACGTTVILRRTGTTWGPDGQTGYPNNILGSWATGVNTIFLAAQTGMAFTSSPETSPQLHVTTAAAGELVNNRSTIDFGNVILPASNSVTFTIANTGNADLTGLAITKSGTHATNFIVTSLTTTTLTSGTNTTFDVTFTPSAGGTRTAALQITSNDPDESPLNIPLTGVGQVPVSFTSLSTSKTVNPGTKVTFTAAATGTLPINYKWQKWNAGTMQFEDVGSAASYVILSATDVHEGDYRVIVDNLPISTLTSSTITLVVNNAISIDVQPASKTVALGTPVSLDVTTSGSDPKKHQWRKNGINLGAPAGTAASYSLAAAQLSNAGDYTVVVSNMVNSKTSTPAASLTVVDTSTKVLNALAGVTTKITAPYAGKATTFVWKRNGGPLPSDPRFTFSKNVLTISSPQVTPINDSDSYTCEITGMDGMTEIARTDLVVYTDKPVIPGADPILMDDAMVGDPTYSFQIPFDPNPLVTPTKFTASPLPSGLVCNPLTGLITGRPAVSISADKTYEVTFTVSNAKGPTTKKARLVLKPKPAGSVGTFTGPIVRTGLSGGLGGRFDLTSSASGSFTGKVTLGAKAHSFSGKWKTDVNGVNAPEATVTIPRKSPLSDLIVTFTADPANHVISIGLVDDGIAPASFTAWKKRWGTAMLPAEKTDLDTYKGYYTFGMDPPVPVVTPPVTPSEVHPQGMGYGAFTVSSTGSLTIAGRLPDNVSYTASTFCGPAGQVLVFKALHSNKGSLLGTLDITQGTMAFVPPYGDNTLGGTVSYLRPAITGTIYKTGFPPADLTAVGGRYVPPAAGTLIFGLTDDGVTPNARLLFTDGGITGTTTDDLGTLTSPDINVRVKTTGGIALPSPNPRSTTLTYNKTTGSFSGRSILLDVNPAKPGTNITRYLYYYGIIFRDTPSTVRGYGEFLLSRRPDAMSAQTILTTDKLSGQVVFEKLP